MIRFKLLQPRLASANIMFILFLCLSAPIIFFFHYFALFLHFILRYYVSHGRMLVKILWIYLRRLVSFSAYCVVFVHLALLFVFVSYFHHHSKPLQIQGTACYSRLSCLFIPQIPFIYSFCSAGIGFLLLYAKWYLIFLIARIYKNMASTPSLIRIFLFKHPFIKAAKPVSILSPMLQDAARIRELINEDSDDDSTDGLENEAVSRIFEHLVWLSITTQFF